MKIAIASDDGKMIAAHFGRTKGFVIFEVEETKIVSRTYIENTFTAHAQGLHHMAHEDKHKRILSALRDVDTVISRGMGRRIYEDLRAAGIKPLIVEEDETDTAIHLYLKNNLQDNPDKGCVH